MSAALWTCWIPLEKPGLAQEGDELVYTYDTKGDRTGITSLMNDLTAAGITFNDLNTTQSSLEEIFVSLVHQS